MNIVSTHSDLPIGVFGDIHGDFNIIQQKLKLYEIENTILFQAGDFGVGFNYNNPREPAKERKRLTMLNTVLKKRNTYLYVIRGNHDNPMFFDGKHNLSNLIFMKDYQIVEVGEHNILCLGGAISVDRKPNPLFLSDNGRTSWKGRREGIDWWPDEKFVYDEKKLDKIGGVDVVISHTVPSIVYPSLLGGSVKNWIKYDPELEQELREERDSMTKAFLKLDRWNMVKFWVGGHFHQTHREKYNTTEFCILDIGEFREIRF